MLKGNKGEWSEIYTLFKILAEKKIFAGDGELSRIDNLFFPIIRIIRDESHSTTDFTYEGDIVLVQNNLKEYRIPIKDFAEYANLLLNEIKGTNDRGAFEIPMVEEFVESYGTNSLKAKSTAKSDIIIQIHDLRTGFTPKLGFSIKSQIGTPSTLLNAGRTTNFIYSIDRNLSEEEVETINSVNTRSKVKDRLEILSIKGSKLVFRGVENSTFENNLILIDSALPVILSELIQTFYTTKHSRLIDLVNEVSNENPLNYNLESNHPFYEYKIKRFLSDIALGMMPSKTWKGKLEATGGYLVVKEDGDILCYHIYNRNEFEDYLFRNTKFETASTKRHSFGEIYRHSNEYFVKLNLQIRFIK